MPFWQGHYSSMLLLVLKSGLVSWKCNRTRYLGMILELSLVLLTPIEQLWPSLDTCPTKSSLLKFMLSWGSCGTLTPPGAWICGIWTLCWTLANLLTRPTCWGSHMTGRTFGQGSCSCQILGGWETFLLHHRHRSNDTGSPRLPTFGIPPPWFCQPFLWGWGGMPCKNALFQHPWPPILDNLNGVSSHQGSLKALSWWAL